MTAVWATRRLWIPFVLALAFLVAAQFPGPVLTIVFMIVGFGFFMDGATLLWSRSGGMMGHRQ